MSLRSFAVSAKAIADMRLAVAQPQPSEVEDGFPDAVVDWLARLRLMMGVPFAYLVPDERLLPLESVRFFYVNRNWTDAAVDGALSVGAVGTRDRAHLHSLHAELREALDRAERRVWSRDTGTAADDGAAEVMTGLLLRSRAVAGWPGLHVRATRDGDAVQLLRMERLAPAVLLALFDGIPDHVEIEEPRAGIQFGVDPPGADRPAASRWVNVRTPATGEPAARPDVRVPFRAGSPGVIDMTTLVDRLEDTGLFGADGVGSGELAIQLLQFPFRQEFGEPAGEIGRVFTVTVPMSVVRASHHLVIRP
jgi:hypothetical protein